MGWTFATLPAAGANIAVDSLPGSLDVQAVKLDAGPIGASQPVASGAGLPTYDDGITTADILHRMESLQNIDAFGRLFVAVASAVITSGVITTLGTITNPVPVGNVATFAGVGIEAYGNLAEVAYNTQISSCMEFN